MSQLTIKDVRETLAHLKEATDALERMFAHADPDASVFDATPSQEEVLVAFDSLAVDAVSKVRDITR